MDEEELLNFGGHPLPDPDLGILKKNSSTLQDKAFSQLGLYLWKKRIGSLYHTCIFG